MTGTTQYGAKTITSTATQIAATDPSRERLTIVNDGAVTVYLGDRNVTTATGYPVEPGVEVTDDSGSEWYGIVASGSGSLRYVVKRGR